MSEAVDTSAVAAQVFSRSIRVPPGAPWDQWRAARLEARHGAPLSHDVVLWSVRRMDRWRPREPARFAIGYVRKDAADVPRRVSATVDGLVVQLRFDRALALPRIEALGLVAAGASAALLGFAGLEAWKARQAKQETLVRLEANAAQAERLARRDRQIAADGALLLRTGLAGRNFADLTEDLMWLGANKAEGVVLQQVTWSPEGLTVRLASEGRPVANQERPQEPVEGQRHTWHIARAAPPVLKDGVRRPSIVSQPPEDAQ